MLGFAFALVGFHVLVDGLMDFSGVFVEICSCFKLSFSNMFESNLLYDGQNKICCSVEAIIVLIRQSRQDGIGLVSTRSLSVTCFWFRFGFNFELM